MQELAIILSSIAGVATAAAVRDRASRAIPRMGASRRIRGQVDSLNIERDILTKTIARLHGHDTGLSDVQRDRLLARYQHQLGIILAKAEKLEEASRHPDLGPVGDGLITLMDQRLSGLDERLEEISSRMEARKTEPGPEKAPERPKEARKPKPVEVPPGPRQRMEITTLTAVHEARDPGPVQTTLGAKPTPEPVQKKAPEDTPRRIPEIIPVPGDTPRTIPEIVPPVPKAPRAQIAPVQKAPEPAHVAPADAPEDEEKELQELKDNVASVLAKLDQAEVE